MKKYEFKNDSNDRELATKEYFDRLPYPVTKHFTEGRFTFYDCSYYVHDPAKKNTYKDKDILMEIKSRNCLSTKYPTTYISKYKYNALVAVGIFQPTRLLVMFQDCMYFFSDIMGAFVGYETKTAPDADVDYEFSEKEKEFAALDMKKGIRIEYSGVVN